MLSIENATHGYDSSNLRALRNKIRLECIEPAAKALLDGISDLEPSIDEIWVGDSAGRFKDKIRSDAELVAGKLQEIGHEVSEYLNEVMVKLQEVDESITF